MVEVTIKFKSQPNERLAARAHCASVTYESEPIEFFDNGELEYNIRGFAKDFVHEICSMDELPEPTRVSVTRKETTEMEL